MRADGGSLRDNVRNEGALLRKIVGDVLVGMVALVAGGVFVIVGAAFLIASLFIALQATMGQASAAAIVGVMAVILGAIAVWTFRKTTQK